MVLVELKDGRVIRYTSGTSFRVHGVSAMVQRDKPYKTKEAVWVGDKKVVRTVTRYNTVTIAQLYNVARIEVGPISKITPAPKQASKK